MESTLTINFPSDEHREAFVDWLSNSGEQDHYNQGEYVDEKDRHLYHLNFSYIESSNGIITTREVED